MNAAAAALARYESQNATDPFHFPLTDHMYLALRETAAGSRFDPDNAALRESLAWHARITADMQRRVLEAEKYVRSHTGDVKLLAILGGDEKAMRLFAGVETHTGEVSA